MDCSQPMAKVIPTQSTVLRPETTPSILAETTGAAAFSVADSEQMPELCIESTFTTDR